MSRFRIKPWMILAAVLLLLVIGFFGTFYLTDRNSTSVAESVAGSAAVPGVSAASGFTASIRDFFNRLFALRDVDKQYETLKARVQYLELANAQMQELQLENERLTEQLGYKDEYPNYTYLPARVIGKEPGSWFINFTLNRGSSDGVKVDMSVVNEKGLIGRVVQVGAKWCKVMAMIDRQSGVSVVVERTRDTGIVRGTGDPGTSDPTCDIYYLPINSDVQPGDRLVTSDMGGFYLKGIPVGTVAEVSRNDKLERTAKLTPYVDFAHVENVMIVKSDQHVPTEAEIAAESSASPQTSGNGTASPTPSPQASPTPNAGSSTPSSPDGTQEVDN